MTNAERSLRHCMMFNTAQFLWEIVDGFNKKDQADPLWRKSKAASAHKARIRKACQSVVKASTDPISDGLLRVFHGEDAVVARRADALRRGMGKVISLRAA